MSNVWFTADTHLGHSRIIDYCKRPFKNHEEMDEALVQRFNEVLRPGDRLYHLGDVAWSSFYLPAFTKRLNTKALYLIYGNHDKQKPRAYEEAGFIWAKDYEKITLGSVPVILFHYPIRSWNFKGHGGVQLYGHCHGTLEPGLGRSMDVGVDTHNFYPYNWDEVYSLLKDRPMFEDDPRDSHNKSG